MISRGASPLNRFPRARSSRPISARIEAVNPHLNAIVRLLANEARAAAAEADRLVAAGRPLGPLHGVPFTVKENIDMAGLPTTWGVPALANAIAPPDAPVVERMRAAGAIPIGRTNLPDMALRIHTDSSLHGLTRNPVAPRPHRRRLQRRRGRGSRHRHELRSASATTSAARCAIRPMPAASLRSAPPPAAFPTRALSPPRIACWRCS